MRVRIKKLPQSGSIEDIDVTRLAVGKTYDLGPRLAELLIVSGYAVPEMRRTERDKAADQW